MEEKEVKLEEQKTEEVVSEGKIYEDGYVVSVCFSNNRPYYFHTYNKDIKKGMDVVVETVRGLELGHVVTDAKDIKEFEEFKAPLKSVTRVATAEDKKAIDEIMERFNLNELRHRKIGDLSGGQQQRVFLARAMVKQPKILLLDEPATGIDTAAKADLYAMLKKINREQGVTIIMVSHDLELAADAAQNALCLDHGICFWGEVHAALKHHHKHGYFYR